MSKILNNEYKRILLEVLIYIPVGIMGGFAFEKRKTIKTVLVVLMGELIFGAAKIKWTLLIYIGQTVWHNIIGTVVGISLYFLVSYCIRKASIWKRVLCLIVPSIMLMYITMQYIICCTNVWGNLYKLSDKYKIVGDLQINYSEEKFKNIMRERKSCMYSLFTQRELNELEKKLFYNVGVNKYNTYIEKNNTITQLPTGAIFRKSINSDGRYIFGVEMDQPRCNIVFIDLERYEKLEESVVKSGEHVLNEVDVNSEEINNMIKVFDSQLGMEINLNKNDVVLKDNCTNDIYFKQYIQIAKDVYNYQSYKINIDEQGNIILFELYDRVDCGWDNLKMYRDNSWYSDFYRADDNIAVQIEDAYQKLCNGGGFIEDFDGDIGVNDVVVTDADIDICEDDKGYLEYVYVFYIEPIYTEDGTLIDRIYVPAMKSYY